MNCGIKSLVLFHLAWITEGMIYAGHKARLWEAATEKIEDKFLQNLQIWQKTWISLGYCDSKLVEMN